MVHGGAGAGAERPASGGCAGGCGCKQRFEELENRVRALQGELGGRGAGNAAVSHRFVPAAPEPVPAAPVAQTAGFSVVPPAQQGRSRITGNAGDHGGRITGPINLARGLVTGTPEFRGRSYATFRTAWTPIVFLSLLETTGTICTSGALRVRRAYIRSSRPPVPRACLYT